LHPYFADFVCLSKKSVAGSKAATNPFKGMKITTDFLKQQLLDFDARSAITSKTFKGMNLKKKEKLKFRRDVWMESESNFAIIASCKIV
jgi:hypothetical protein